MHLAILTQYYPPEIGAPQRRLSHLAGRFVQAGHAVTVLTGMPNYPQGVLFPGYGGAFSREQRENVAVIRTLTYPAQGVQFLPRLTSYFTFVISSAVMGSAFLPAPDYLLVESPPLFLGLSGYWLSRLKSARLIFNVADLWPESAVRLGLLRRDSLAFRWSERLERFCYRKAWLVTGQSKTILQDVQQRFPETRLFHLSNGVDTRLFRPDNASASARSTMCGNGDFLAVYAGLHGLAQGLDQILDAAAMLKSQGGFQFVFIGDGPQKKALQSQASSRALTNVRFLDPQQSDQMPRLLASADALLVPLKGFIPGAVPSKLYEAMGCGRPVVLMADGEAAEVVRKANSGIVVQPGDTPAIAQALRRLREESQLGTALGENGRKAVLESFDRNHIAESFMQYLQAELAP
ncbi:MAG: glycosyltransferase family 4 protein [Terriglobales bacterium]